MIRAFDINSYKDNYSKYFLMSFLAGGFASFFTICFVYPLDYARTRLGVDIGRTLEQREFKGLKDCIIKTYKANGIRGLYAGFVISSISLFLYRGLYFGTYDFGRGLFIS